MRGFYCERENCTGVCAVMLAEDQLIFQLPKPLRDLEFDISNNFGIP